MSDLKIKEIENSRREREIIEIKEEENKEQAMKK
jgi:hypothetical protein